MWIEAQSRRGEKVFVNFDNVLYASPSDTGHWTLHFVDEASRKPLDIKATDSDLRGWLSSRSAKPPS
ncbi:hypothetical protein [Pseudaminobacter sp. NGMCC 1.201702]|uniref:hypothetical protein n=1 Tax=Pseudaminobacter sp. NGMCC 1.201702 TaxID=3391825 RepID=UPI0039EE8A60